MFVLNTLNVYILHVSHLLIEDVIHAKEQDFILQCMQYLGKGKKILHLTPKEFCISRFESSYI